MTTKTEITLNEIQQFFSEQKIAVAGASRNPKKFGGMVIKDFKEKGFDMFPVNPNAEEVQGLKSYKTVADLPGDVKHLLVVTPKEKTQEIINQAVQKGMKMMWVQQMSDTPEALAALKKSGIPFIYKKCIYMFAEPVKGVHHFHRFLVKFFGGYPKKKSN